MPSSHIYKKVSVPRRGLHDLGEVLFKKFQEKNNLLANIHGIGGMGKTLFLEDVLTPLLNSKEIVHSPKPFKIPKPPESTDALIVKSKEIAEWVYSTVLKQKGRLKLSNNLDKLEREYFELRGKLAEKKDNLPFAVLVDDVSNFPFDDLDWFQSVVLETICLASNSIVILTSQNELNWPSWEMRNRCVSEKLPVFGNKEILELCGSHPLANKIAELSAGHPRTVQKLINIAQQQNKTFSFITEKDVNDLTEKFFEVLGKEIDSNLDFGDDNGWLREVFYITSAADGFDADLVGDLVSAFKDQIFKGKNEIPLHVTDLAWEMAFTGLAGWNFDEKVYTIAPELRERIVKYMENSEKNNFVRALEIIANSYLARAAILKEWDVQLVNYIYYLAQAGAIEKNKSEVAQEIKNSLKQFLLTADQREHLLNIITKSQKINQISKISEIYSAILGKDNGKEIVEFIGTNVNQGEVMNTKTKPEQVLFGIYEPRELEEKEFDRLITDKLEGKWILGIKGGAGLGKSRLLGHLYDVAKERGYDVVLLDLHYRRNRRVRVMLRELINQLNIKDIAVELSMKKLEQTGLSGVDYIGSGPRESFEEASREAATAISQSLNRMAVEKGQRSIILIDTFDDDPSISYLASWLFNELILKLENSIYLVSAGRKSLDSVWNISEDILTRNKLIEMTSLDLKAIHSMARKFRPESQGLRGRLGEKIAELSQGNPLIAAWLLFYHSRFPREEDLDGLKNEYILDNLAAWMLDKKDYSTRVMRVAAHFGSHFNLELFKAVIPHSQIEGTYESIFNELAKYFYTRSTIENWTLHDEIRERILKALKERSGPSLDELRGFSRKAVDRHYDPRINDLKRRRPLNPDDQAELEDLEAERYYHLLFSDGQNYYRELWDHFDNLWHRFRLEQMAQVIQFGREVQSWRPTAEKDKLLTNLLDAAQAWMHYSEGNYTKARELAMNVIDSNDDNYKPPRRLHATAQVVLGFTTQNPEEAIITYLKPAQNTYQELRSELEKNETLPNNEFCDSLYDIYQELHMVLLEIGKMQWQYFHNLDQGEKALQEAYEMANKKSWNKPLYQATALNEWARIRRFKGDFNDAFNKVIRAIAIYEEHNQRDINLGVFYETLGLVYKANEQYHQALIQFNRSLQIYSDVQGPVEKFESTVNLEIGHVHFLNKNYAEAERYYQSAHKVVKSLNTSRLYYYYLSVLNKLGELNIALYKADNNKNYLSKAKEYHIVQRDLAKSTAYDLWAYWAVQNLAEIDFEENWEENKESLKSTLNDLLNEYDKKLHREFGPAFWETKFLFYRIAIKENDFVAALTHLAEGLSYLAETWKIRFNRNLGLLRSELLRLETEERSDEAKRLTQLWKNRFGDEDPAPEFLETCKSFII